jgi:regulator of protease activity HflC (stomatin/prohibitin superfamily)
MSDTTQALSSNSHVKDVEIASRDGFVVLVGHALATLGALLASWQAGGVVAIVLAVLTLVVSFFFLGGYYILDPNQAAVHTFFGRYVGTVTRNGFRWNNPFYSTQKVSLRVLNFESKELKVNDLDGNPINISAVVVWRVKDSASAIFSVDDYEEFIGIQTESALRHLATAYSYDSHNDGQMSLRESQNEIAERLKAEIQERAILAGLDIIEARLNKLSYAAEIASAMLQRQQAQAVVSARKLIVEGAVGMVQLALDKLKTDGVVELDEERKAQMVSNLLVVLCSDRSASPVINAGSIHS